MTTPLTVIMPVRNGERYLTQALQSLAAQTHRAFVLHVWDDGSDDSTAKILDRWLSERLPGRVIGHGRIGIGKALARLVDSAATDLIARMDADDLCDPKRFARQIDFMQANPRVAVLGTQMRRINAATGEQLSATAHPTDDASLRWALRLNNPINHPTAMMRRAAVLDRGNYRDLRPGQDDDLWLRIAQRHRMANLPDTLLTYREHDASVTALSSQGTQRFRERRMQHADRVFPGLTLAESQRLTHLLTHPDELGVTRQDIEHLETAAQEAARLCREADDYFKRTAQYRQQRLNLRIRWFKSRPVLRQAWPVVRQAGQLARACRVDHASQSRPSNPGGAAWASRA